MGAERLRGGDGILKGWTYRGNMGAGCLEAFAGAMTGKTGF